jgi:hypothetical protein
MCSQCRLAVDDASVANLVHLVAEAFRYCNVGRGHDRHPQTWIVQYRAVDEKVMMVTEGAPCRRQFRRRREFQRPVALFAVV